MKYLYYYNQWHVFEWMALQGNGRFDKRRLRLRDSLGLEQHKILIRGGLKTFMSIYKWSIITNFAICPKTNPAAPPISDINCQVLMRVCFHILCYKVKPNFERWTLFFRKFIVLPYKLTLPVPYYSLPLYRSTHWVISFLFRKVKLFL